MSVLTATMRGQLWDASWDDYLGESVRLSNTFLGDLIDKGPAFARARQQGWAGAPKVSMRKGTYTHAAIWEGPIAFASRFIVGDKRTKEGKNLAEAANTTVIRAGEYSEAMRMAEAVARAAKDRAADGDTFLADVLAAPGLREQSMLWEDEETGSLLKGRADKVIPTAKVMVDLKIARNWRPMWQSFGRDARRYGYHRQAWLYSDAFEAIWGEPCRFILIVVHSEKPYEVVLYEFGEQELELGRDEARRAMRLAALHEDESKWHAPEQRGVVRIVYPHFVYQDAEMGL